MAELGSLLVRSHHEVAALPSQQHQHTAGCLLIATMTPLLSAPAPLNDGPRASGASYAESRETIASCSYPGAAAPNHSLTRDARAAHHSASAVFKIRENASGSPFWLSHPSRLTHSSTARTPSSTTATGTKNARRCSRGAINATAPRSSRRIDGPPRQQPKRRLPAPKPFARLATGAHPFRPAATPSLDADFGDRPPESTRSHAAAYTGPPPRRLPR
jgi:hypothetical protein